jgi:hypothetical protein
MTTPQTELHSRLSDARRASPPIWSQPMSGDPLAVIAESLMLAGIGSFREDTGGGCEVVTVPTHTPNVVLYVTPDEATATGYIVGCHRTDVDYGDAEWVAFPDSMAAMVDPSEDENR